MAERILIVDDEPVSRRLLEAACNRLGYETTVAAGGDEALRFLTGAEGLSIGCVLLDLVMPDLDGLGVLGRMRDAGLGMPVIVAAAHSGVDGVMSAMRAGAVDFIVKPVGAERLQVSLENALTRRTRERELARLDSGSLNLNALVARGSRMRDVVSAARKSADTCIPMLVEGEPGAGKKLLACAIHGSSPRRTRPFVAVDLRATPPRLIDSILFGGPEGPRIGAADRRVGKFVEADGGTLYLGHIDRLSPETQADVLRVLRGGELMPAGARRPIRIDVRVIAATCRNLLTEVQAGRFREDLFYRLQATRIALPPLRERRDDLPDLVCQFAARFAAQQGKRIRAVTPAALGILQDHPWPGNVGELERVILRAVALTDGEEIGLAQLGQLSAGLAARSEDPRTARDGLPLVFEDGVTISPVPGIMEPNHPPGPAESVRLLGPDGEVRSLEEIEAEAIRFAVTRCGGSMSKAARRLRIGRSTLYRKLEGFGLPIVQANGVTDDAWRAGDSATKSRELVERSIARKASYVK